jgi:hypothetical protein
MRTALLNSWIAVIQVGYQLAAGTSNIFDIQRYALLCGFETRLRVTSQISCVGPFQPYTQQLTRHELRARAVLATTV